MASGKSQLNSLRRRIRALLNFECSRMCWELGHFQAPIFIKEPLEVPIKPYMLVCIDTASTAIMGSDLVRDPPSPQGLLSLLVSSMEKPLVGSGAPVLPQIVRLDDPAVFELIGREVAQLGIQVELVKRLPALHAFKKIIEHDLFSHQKGYAGVRIPGQGDRDSEAIPITIPKLI